MPGGVSGHHLDPRKVGGANSTSGQRPQVLLNSLQSAADDPAPKVNGAEAEKLCLDVRQIREKWGPVGTVREVVCLLGWPCRTRWLTQHPKAEPLMDQAGGRVP